MLCGYCPRRHVRRFKRFRNTRFVPSLEVRQVANFVSNSLYLIARCSYYYVYPLEEKLIDRRAMYRYCTFTLCRCTQSEPRIFYDIPHSDCTQRVFLPLQTHVTRNTKRLANVFKFNFACVYARTRLNYISTCTHAYTGRSRYDEKIFLSIPMAALLYSAKSSDGNGVRTRFRVQFSKIILLHCAAGIRNYIAFSFEFHRYGTR